jgi:hypothetical protein
MCKDLADVVADCVPPALSLLVSAGTANAPTLEQLTAVLGPPIAPLTPDDRDCKRCTWLLSNCVVALNALQKALWVHIEEPDMSAALARLRQLRTRLGARGLRVQTFRVKFSTPIVVPDTCSALFQLVQKANARFTVVGVSVDLNERRAEVFHKNAFLTVSIEGGRAQFADFNSRRTYVNCQPAQDDRLIWLFETGVTMFENVRELCESL